MSQSNMRDVSHLIPVQLTEQLQVFVAMQAPLRHGGSHTAVCMCVGERIQKLSNYFDGLKELVVISNFC